MHVSHIQKKRKLILTDQNYLAMTPEKHRSNKVRLDRQFLSNLQESCKINHITPMHIPAGQGDGRFTAVQVSQLYKL